MDKVLIFYSSLQPRFANVSERLPAEMWKTEFHSVALAKRGEMQTLRLVYGDGECVTKHRSRAFTQRFKV